MPPCWRVDNDSSSWPEMRKTCFKQLSSLCNGIYTCFFILQLLLPKAVTNTAPCNFNSISSSNINLCLKFQSITLHLTSYSLTTQLFNHCNVIFTDNLSCWLSPYHGGDGALALMTLLAMLGNMCFPDSKRWGWSKGGASGITMTRGTNLMKQLWFIIINNSTCFGHIDVRNM